MCIGGEAIIIISNTPKPKLSESINKLPPLTSFDEVYDGGEKDKKKSAFNKSYNSLSASDSSREKVRRGMKKTSLLQQISENKQNLSGNISHIAKHQYFNQRSSYTKSRSYGDHHHHSSSTSHGNGVGFHSRSGYRFNNSSGRVNNTKHGLQHGYGNRGLSRSHGRAAMNQNSQRSPPIACHASISRSSSLSSASVVERGQVGRKPKQHQFQQDQSTMLKGETNVIRVINGKMKVTMAEADDINHNQEEQSGDSVAKPIKSPTVEEKEGQIIHETMINDSAGVAHDNNNSSTSNNREPDLYRGGSSARNHMRDIKHGKLDSINSTGSVGSSGSSGIRHPYHTPPRGMKRTSNLKPVRGGNSANSITMKSVASMSNVKNMNKVQHSGRAQAAFETRRISSSGTRHDDTQTASETRALGSGNEKTDKVSSSSRGMTRTVRLDSALPFLVDTALHASNRRNSSQGSAPQHRHTSRALVNSHGGANRSSKGNPRRPRGMTRTVKLSDQSRTFRHENLHRGFSNISNNGSRNDGIRSSPSSVSANPF